MTGETEEEMAKATQSTKEQIAFYGSTPAYRPVLELHGWGEVGDELNAMSKRGQWVEMGDLITDDMLDAFAVVGEPDDVAGKFRARYGPLLDRISFYMPYRADPDADPRDDRRAQGLTRSQRQRLRAIQSSSAGPLSKLEMSAYRGSVPGWHTTCHRRCVSTTNRAPRCSGTRISVDGSGRPSGPCSMRIMKLSGLSVSSIHERTTQPSPSGLKRLLSSRWIWRSDAS